MYPVSNNSLTMDSTNWPYIKKRSYIISWKAPQKCTKYQQQQSTTVTQKLWYDSSKNVSLSIIDVWQAHSKLCTELVPSLILKGTNLTKIVGQYITPVLFNPSNWSKWVPLRSLKSGTNYLLTFHNTPLTGGWICKRNHNMMLGLFTVLILGRSNSGVFKHRVNKKSILLVQGQLMGTAFLIIEHRKTSYDLCARKRNWRKRNHFNVRA